jgi:hypothetical protein
MGLKLFFFILGLAPMFLLAQQPVANNYPFRTGIYSSFSDFSSDSPAFDSILNQLQYDLNSEENILILKSESQALLDSITNKEV